METIATMFGAVGRAVGQVLDLGVMALGGPSGTFHNSPTSVHQSDLAGTTQAVAVDPWTGRMDVLGRELPDPFQQDDETGTPELFDLSDAHQEHLMGSSSDQSLAPSGCCLQPSVNRF